MWYKEKILHCNMEIEKKPRKSNKLFTCEKCTASFSFKSDYDRHVNKKIPCGEEKEQYIIHKRTCKYCDVLFADNSSVKKHMNICHLRSIEAEKMEQIIAQLSDNINTQNNELKQIIAQLINKIDEQNKELKEKAEHVIICIYKCPHNRRKQYCKICDGRSLCKSEWCETTRNNKYDGYCAYCYVNLYPNKIIAKNYKTKELNVVDNVKKYYPDFTWITDKKIQDGCSKRRPDMLLDLGTHIIIVEVDENAHTDYDCSCETKRLMELSEDVGHRPIVFIRFNPDKYVDRTGEVVKSCWKINKTSGILQINSNKENEWEERITALNDQIQYWIDNPSEKTIEIIELFY
jgi:uncharacterized C2H2 Zn-finger protein